jgi:hypothetical protein
MSGFRLPCAVARAFPAASTASTASAAAAALAVALGWRLSIRTRRCRLIHRQIVIWPFVDIRVVDFVRVRRRIRKIVMTKIELGRRRYAKGTGGRRRARRLGRFRLHRLARLALAQVGSIPISAATAAAAAASATVVGLSLLRSGVLGNWPFSGGLLARLVGFVVDRIIFDRMIFKNAAQRYGANGTARPARFRHHGRAALDLVGRRGQRRLCLDINVDAMAVFNAAELSALVVEDINCDLRRKPKRDRRFLLPLAMFLDGAQDAQGH